jgi:hypothetical protein
MDVPRIPPLQEPQAWDTGLFGKLISLNSEDKCFLDLG